MSKFQFTSGKIQRPYFVVAYGVNGGGKSTFASEFPKTDFIDIEESTGNIEVFRRLSKPKTFTEAKEMIEFALESKDSETVAIDTIDYLENLLVKEICDKNKVEALIDMPYGKGYELLKSEWGALIDLLEKYRNKKHIVLLGHEEIKEYNDPSQPVAFKRHQLKLSRHGSAMVKDKTDAVLFFNYDTIVSIDSKTKQARAFGGDTRVMLTEYRASHDGKNRFGLPYKIELVKGKMFSAFDAAVKAGNAESFDVLCSQIAGLLEKPMVEEVKKKASEGFEVAKASRDITKLAALNNRLKEITRE